MQWWFHRAAVVGRGERRMSAEAWTENFISTPWTEDGGSGSVAVSRRHHPSATCPAKKPTGEPAGSGCWSSQRIMTPGPRRSSLMYVRRLMRELSNREGKASRSSALSVEGGPRMSQTSGENLRG